MVLVLAYLVHPLLKDRHYEICLLFKADEGKHISMVLSYYAFMKWVCNYCLKMIEKDNFIDVLEKSMEDEEYHSWRRIVD